MATLESNPRMPASVAGYRIEKSLGSGGMGSVYLASAPPGAPSSRRWAAIKLLHPHLERDPEAKLEFIEEGRLAVQIRHPNVVRVWQLGEDAAGVFIAMEYIEGLTLSALLRELQRRSGDTAPDPAIVLRILDDVLLGLHAAHELRGPDGALLNLVHRDISPPNILVGRDGVSRITDFGIAKALNRTSYTQEGIIKGKVGYISPEHVYEGKLDRRSDIWCSAVVAWEAFAGKRLFTGDTFEALRKAIERDAPRLAPLRPDLPRGFSDVLARALARKPEERFPTAEAFRQALMGEWASCGGRLADRSVVTELVHAGHPVEKGATAPGPQPLAAPALGVSAANETRVAEPTNAFLQLIPDTEVTDVSDTLADALPSDRSSREVPRTLPQGSSRAAPVTARISQPRLHDGQSPRHTVSKVALGMVAFAGLLTALLLTGNEPPPDRQVAPLTPPLLSASLARQSAAERKQSAMRALPPAPQPEDEKVPYLAPKPEPKAAVSRAPSSRTAHRRKRFEGQKVRISANGLITQLQLGEREIDVDEPSRSLWVPLLQHERRESLWVEAVSRDGRSGAGWLEPGERSVRLTLSPPAKRRRGARGSAASSKRSPLHEPALARNRYEARR